ncbi:retron St85 family RNA-directed DNA polymerase [Apibacter sp. HY039]|uniref:retron St85 family RNA-directed DNA polymerase n=1 Tax=Apibacter sp. HY039 TaxID=2501476 RepID=UPI000FEB6F53|nr:retron St85 family RNA-directed DNA polymerase [Apibacter sp. HY039]
MSEKLTKQQIYDRIRATSKDSYILEEMQRLGFWEKTDSPQIPEIFIENETRLLQELNQLLDKNKQYSDQLSMLKSMRKVRMKNAKEKREITRQNNKLKALEKAERWQKLQQEQVLFLGKQVSKGLNNTEPNVNSLKKFNLPVFHSVVEFAGYMETDLPSLRYLLYQRKVSTINHYHTFELPKKSGGKRKISAPKPKIKALQLQVLDKILKNIPVNDYVHGFIQGKSIVSNAQPHVNKDIVINMDLKDFFPSIEYKRVKGLFNKLGYSEQISTMLALVCTQSDTYEVNMDGVTYHVQKGARFLPQGSPASPAISNLIAYKLDKRIKGLAERLNFTYTRYADDLSFSTTNENQKNIRQLLFFVNQIVVEEGFKVHPEKTHIMRKGNLQMVTGIVVNRKLNIERKKLRNFRALLHNLNLNGWKDQKWGNAVHLIHAVEGYIRFVKMVNPEKGKEFAEKLATIIKKQGYPEISCQKYNSNDTTEKTTASITKPETNQKEENDSQDWWDIF